MQPFNAGLSGPTNYLGSAGYGMAKQSFPAMSYAMPNNIALFIDLENFIGSAATLGLPIDISKVITKLREIGNVRSRKAYGDMQRALQAVGMGNRFYEIRRDFHANLIEVEDIPYITPHKNAADIKLVVEALSVGYQNEFISHFAVLASDRDYVPLYQKLRALNKTVITIGVDRTHMNPMIAEASDRLFYYEHLFLGDTVSALYETEEQTSPLRFEYFDLLTRSLRKLEHDNIMVSAEALYESMRNARSDFDFALIGCQSFPQFLHMALENGCIEEDTQNQTFRVSVKSAQVASAPPASEITKPSPAVTEADAKKEAKIYRKILSDTLKIPFPELQVRKDTIRVIHKALDEHFGITIKEALTNDDAKQSGNLTFNEITDIVQEKFQEDATEANRSVIYKIVLGLHFARCFYEQRGEVSDLTSIEVTGMAKPYDVWEDDLYRNYIGQLKFNLQSRTLQNSGLAKLLYESIEDEAMRKIEALRT
ncbi:hypothetical protein AGMMS50276_09480 [Synergistales bacterium]|nr:hypothetical protein AGMMS50276_09480 [Synergistales bacterium]